MDIKVRIISLLIGYLIGSINPAYIAGRLIGHMDIREVGSKNAGTSNVFMTFGPKYGIFIFLADGFKTVIACMFAYFIFIGFSSNSWYPLVSGISSVLPCIAVLYAGMGCIIGHDFPFYLGFRGGKGTACWILWIFMLDYRIFFISMILAFLTGWRTKYMAVATAVLVIVTCITLAVFAFEPERMLLFILFSALSMYMHRNNFKNLINHKEPKIYG